MDCQTFDSGMWVKTEDLLSHDEEHFRRVSEPEIRLCVEDEVLTTMNSPSVLEPSDIRVTANFEERNDASLIQLESAEMALSESECDQTNLLHQTKAFDWKLFRPDSVKEDVNGTISFPTLSRAAKKRSKYRRRLARSFGADDLRSIAAMQRDGEEVSRCLASEEPESGDKRSLVIDSGAGRSEDQLDLRYEGGDDVISEASFNDNDEEEESPQEIVRVISAKLKRPKPSRESLTKRYICDTCFKDFSRAGDLKTHARIHTGEKPYSCPHCSKAFCAPATLRTHLRIHTGEKPYCCQHCGKTLSDLTAFKKHLQAHTGIKAYHCKTCGKGFPYSSAYRNHLRIHAGVKPYVCRFCVKAFPNGSDLKRHERVHTGEKPYKCADCPKAFSDYSVFKKHTRIHTGVKPYKCSICERAFTASAALKRHSMVHSGEKPHQCEICGRAFADASSLRGHVKRIHSGVEEGTDDQLLEEQAQFVDASSNSLVETKHNSCLLNEGRSSASYGNESAGQDSTSQYHSNDTMNDNMKVSVSYLSHPNMTMDELSDMTYNDTGCSIEHRERDEELAGDVTRIEMGDGDMDNLENIGSTMEELDGDEPRSDAQQIQLDEQRFLTAELDAVETSREEACAMPDVVQVPETSFVLDNQSVKSFVEIFIDGDEKAEADANQDLYDTNKSELSSSTANDPVGGGDDVQDQAVLHESHPSNEPTRKRRRWRRQRLAEEQEEENKCTEAASNKEEKMDQDKDYQCPICGKTFASSFGLKRHSQIHTGEKPFTCSVCGKSFSQSGSLKLHLGIHSGEKPYKCQKCDKSFSQCYSLKFHEKAHLGDKPHMCEQCGKKFLRSSDLKTHIRIHTGEKPFHCQICPKSFCAPATLKTHMRTHTGEKPYCCQHCGKSLSDLTSFKKHLLVHSGEKPFLCQQCGKGFPYLAAYKKHLRMHPGK